MTDIELCKWCNLPLLMHTLEQARRCVFEVEWETRSELEHMIREQERQTLLMQLRKRGAA